MTLEEIRKAREFAALMLTSPASNLEEMDVDLREAAKLIDRLARYAGRAKTAVTATRKHLKEFAA
jgi:hypothetical protein